METSPHFTSSPFTTPALQPQAPPSTPLILPLATSSASPSRSSPSPPPRSWPPPPSLPLGRLRHRRRPQEPQVLGPLQSTRPLLLPPPPAWLSVVTPWHHPSRPCRHRPCPYRAHRPCLHPQGQLLAQVLPQPPIEAPRSWLRRWSWLTLQRREARRRERRGWGKATTVRVAEGIW